MRKILIILGILACINLLIVTISKAFANEAHIDVYSQSLSSLN